MDKRLENIFNSEYIRVKDLGFLQPLSMLVHNFNENNGQTISDALRHTRHSKFLVSV